MNKASFFSTVDDTIKRVDAGLGLDETACWKLSSFGEVKVQTDKHSRGSSAENDGLLIATGDSRGGKHGLACKVGITWESLRTGIGSSVESTTPILRASVPTPETAARRTKVSTEALVGHGWGGISTEVTGIGTEEEIRHIQGFHRVKTDGELESKSVPGLI